MNLKEKFTLESNNFPLSSNTGIRQAGVSKHQDRKSLDNYRTLANPLVFPTIVSKLPLSTVVEDKGSESIEKL